MTNLSIQGRNAQEVASGKFAVEVDVADFDGTNDVRILDVPANCLITDVRMLILKAFNPGVSLSIKTGTNAAGTMGADVAGVESSSTSDASETSPQVKGNSYSFTETGRPAVSSDSGKAVWIDPSATVTSGKVLVIVEYIKYTVKTGVLLPYTE